jgi:hypothetical protein
MSCARYTMMTGFYMQVIIDKVHTLPKSRPLLEDLF